MFSTLAQLLSVGHEVYMGLSTKKTWKKSKNWNPPEIQSVLTVMFLWKWAIWMPHVQPLFPRPCETWGHGGSPFKGPHQPLFSWLRLIKWSGQLSPQVLGNQGNTILSTRSQPGLNQVSTRSQPGLEVVWTLVPTTKNCRWKIPETTRSTSGERSYKSSPIIWHTTVAKLRKGRRLSMYVAYKRNISIYTTKRYTYDVHMYIYIYIYIYIHYSI